MKLQEILPPYDRECVECDEKNPNSWDVDFWQKWIDSVDFVRFTWSKNLFHSSDLVATDGFRGVRVGEKHETTSTCYYNVHCGYKIIEE